MLHCVASAMSTSNSLARVPSSTWVRRCTTSAYLRFGPARLVHADVYFTQRAELEEIRSLYRANTVGQMLVLAWRGDEAATRASASAMAKESSECSLGLNAVHIDAALAILELGLGNYTAATRAASEGWKNEIATNVLIAADAIEAHARSGTPELAAEYVALLDERAAATNMPLERRTAGAARGRC